MKRELKSLALPSVSETEEVDNLCAFLAKWREGDERPLSEEHVTLRKRLMGTVGRWKDAHVATALRRVQRSGVISTKELRAWEKYRHAAAHGGFATGKDVMRWIERCRRTQVLFHKLVFLVIGYEGPFTNWGVEGWSSATFSIPESLAEFRRPAE